MLNIDSLGQLKGLKAQMEAEKEHAEAVVKGTQARYGFAVLDDGREIFIPPDEMLKAFPDDRVRVCIRPAKGDKPVAEIERLVNCPIGEFTGQCVRKGKAVFVQPDLPKLSRWLFIPPHARNGVSEGDYVRCAVLRHPIKDGKPQAKVLSVLGNQETEGIENLYASAKYQLPDNWSNETNDELKVLLDSDGSTDSETRRDLTDLEFVSIDASKTQDIDDALYADASADGWTLYVAIADPSARIAPGSTLEQEIADRSTSVYFHGDVIPMMPEALSQDTCALAEGVDRPALVCKLAISDAGEVGDYEFIEATVRSKAKLSYVAVDRYLSGNYDELMSHATPLEALYQVFRALRSRREEHELVMEDRNEFRWILNDQKKIDHIEPSTKLQSHRMVEECMIAANRSAARFLVDHNCNGPFMCHRGFRKDRHKEARTFLEKYLPEFVDKPLDDRGVYREIMTQLSASTEMPLRSMVNRMLARAELGSEPDKHMGMALEGYTNCTSPLRKFTDFMVHRQIKDVLNGGSGQLVNPEILQNLSANLARCRAATGEAERRLLCHYMAGLEPAPYKAKISHINSSGFTAQLLDNGIEGTVDLRKDPEKFSFDRWTATLTSPTRSFQVEQELVVELARIDDASMGIVFKVVEEAQ